MKPFVVYIAGPITLGDSFVNVRQACLVWEELLNLGFVPICPHWSALQQFVSPIEYKQWLQYDFHLIELCDAILRLPGESRGADAEEQHATIACIPVFHTIEELCNYRTLLPKLRLCGVPPCPHSNGAT